MHALHLPSQTAARHRKPMAGQRFAATWARRATLTPAVLGFRVRSLSRRRPKRLKEQPTFSVHTSVCVPRFTEWKGLALISGSCRLPCCSKRTLATNLNGQDRVVLQICSGKLPAKFLLFPNLLLQYLTPWSTHISRILAAPPGCKHLVRNSKSPERMRGINYGLAK